MCTTLPERRKRSWHTFRLLAAVLCLPTAAQAADWRDCLKLADDRARLACYDSFTRAKTPPSAAPAQGASASASAPALAHRLDNEQAASKNPFAVRAYKPNYFLPFTYAFNRLDNPVYGFKPQREEAKFQISLQVDVWKNPLGPGTAVYFAYTQLSLWQMYNTSASSPFRETNYTPEGGLDWTLDARFLGLDFRKLRFSYIHQSNGQGGARSRSWNRLAVQTAFERGALAGAIRGWYRIPEPASRDDNPDITHYLGYGDLLLAYRFAHGTLSTRLRNNLNLDHNRGAIEINYSFPLTSRIKGYVQFFNGYGETLIDYNRSVSRIGFGFALTDWL